VIPVTVRALETRAEIEAFYRLAVQAFSEAEDIDGAARMYRLSHETSPDFHRGQRRGAFVGNTLVGGYLMLERWLLMKPARIRTACIGSVVTHPDYRHGGVGTAMMHDAEAHARYRGHALLVLNGIPNFYARLGYADIFDIARHAVRQWAIPAAPPLLPVRPAALGDAPALLALYRRHYGGYSGSFVRTLNHQRHHLKFQIDRGFAPLVVDLPDGSIGGYLQPTSGADDAHAREVAAESWPVALALLHAHLARAACPPELWWPLPTDSPTFLLLADNLSTPSRVRGEPIAFPLRTTINVDPRAGWMARPGHLSLLFQQLLPLWTERWARRGGTRLDGFTLVVGDESHSFVLDERDVRVSGEQLTARHTAVLSSEVFTQLLFGYRTAYWAATRPFQHIPEVLLPAFEVLFPPGSTWIPGSDVF
jgi:predicted N-acetyltransferase YhbS